MMAEGQAIFVSLSQRIDEWNNWRKKVIEAGLRPPKTIKSNHMAEQGHQWGFHQPGKQPSIKEEYRRCGKGNCKCFGPEGILHGPYTISYGRREYLGKG